MEKYKCGHKIEPVIINTTEENLYTYLLWKEDNSNLCLKCWLNKDKLIIRKLVQSIEGCPRDEFNKYAHFIIKECHVSNCLYNLNQKCKLKNK